MKIKSMGKPFVVGIDPSLAATGLTLDRKTSMTIKSRYAEGDDRLRLIYGAVVSYAMGADLAVIEDLPANAMSAGLTGMSQGAVRMALRDLGVPYVKIPPATVKKAATGKGNATKPQMRKSVEDFVTVGDVELNIKDDNQVDSFWLRESGLTLLGHHSLLTDPEALNKYLTTPPIREAVGRLG